MKTESRFLREFILVQSRKDTVQPFTGGIMQPLIHSSPDFPSPLWLSVCRYPLQVYSEDSQLLIIDERVYYGNGIIGQVVDLVCKKFQAHILREMAMPEIFESVDEFFNDKLAYIYHCIIDAFNELGLKSFEDKCFRIAHQKGITFLVSRISDAQ